MDAQLEQWRKEGKYLPDFLKDFHDQKDFFKMMYERMPIEDSDHVKDINWVSAQIFTIDFLLWYCARFGYTLQKSRAHQNFEDIHEAINNTNNQRSEMFTKMLSQQLAKNKDESIEQ